MKMLEVLCESHRGTKALKALLGSIILGTCMFLGFAPSLVNELFFILNTVRIFVGGADGLTWPFHSVWSHHCHVS